jgi:translation elongation factor EF-Tu-like GTPase
MAAGTTPVVRMPTSDDPWAAAGELLDAVQSGCRPVWVSASADVRVAADPFLMQVEYALGGTTAAGPVLRGEIGAGEPVEVIGPGVHFLITCAALWIPARGHADRVTAGQTVGLTLGETAAGQLRAGQLIAVPRTVIVQARFRGWAHILEDDDP